MLWGVLLKRAMWVLDFVIVTIVAIVGSKVLSDKVGQYAKFPAVETASLTGPSGRVRDIPPESHFELIAKTTLFGPSPDAVEEVEEPEEEVTTTEETQLNLELTGIYYPRVAIIFNREGGEHIQKAYLEGDEIVEKPQVVLAEVLQDHVLIRLDDRTERLSLWTDMDMSLPGSSGRALAGNRGVRPVMGPRGVRTQPPIQRPGPGRPISVNMAEVMKEAQQEDVQEILRQIRPEVVREGGRPIGLKVTQLKDHPLFRKIGVQEGDIFTSVNGQPIDSFQKAYEMAQRYQNARSLRIGIIRDKRRQFLTYNIAR